MFIRLRSPCVQPIFSSKSSVVFLFCCSRLVPYSFYCSRPGGFFQASGRVFSSSSKHFDQSNHLLPLKSMVNTSNLISFQKCWSVLCWLFKSISKKIARWKSLHYHQNDRQLAVVTFLVFALIPNEGKITSKSRSWSWIAIETQCIFDKHYWFFFKKNIEL